MTPQPDFKAALEVLRSHNTWRRGCDVTAPTDPKQLGVAIDTAIVALQIADALMGEPTEESVAVGFLKLKLNRDGLRAAFKAMRDELLKGIL